MLIPPIPDVILSAVIASVLTFGGVLLSNRSSTKRLQIQLMHDSEEKAKQRKADLRKEIYLNVAEEIVKANAFLGSIPQLDIAKVNPGEGLQGLFAAAAKLQVIAEQKTSLLVSDLVGLYGELLLKFLARTQPIHQIQIDINIRDNHYNRAQAEVNRILAAMNQLNEKGKPDEAAFSSLSRSFEFYQNQCEQLAAEMEELWRKRNALQKEFVKEFFEEMKRIWEQGTYVSVEIRRELEIDGNIEQFLQQMQKQSNHMSHQLDLFLKQIDNA